MASGACQKPQRAEDNNEEKNNFWYSWQALLLALSPSLFTDSHLSLPFFPTPSLTLSLALWLRRVFILDWPHNAYCCFCCRLPIYLSGLCCCCLCVVVIIVVAAVLLLVLLLSCAGVCNAIKVSLHIYLAISFVIIFDISNVFLPLCVSFKWSPQTHTHTHTLRQLYTQINSLDSWRT